MSQEATVGEICENILELTREHCRGGVWDSPEAEAEWKRLNAEYDRLTGWDPAD